MTLRAGAAFVDLFPRVARGFESNAERQMSGPLGRIGQRLGGVGSKLAVGLSTGLAGATASVTAFVFDAGAKLDDALDNIRINSGFTGDALASLEGSFRNVAKRVPGDLGLVSDAVVGLAQRTGQTGPALESLATQVVTLARITKKDLNTTIEDSTRFFGDWGVQVKDQAGSLDFLFKLSQQTGVGVDFLQQKLVQFGGPLRQLGFSMEESAALVAKFQKEGVNTELVLGSMRQALGRMARAGEAPAATLRRVMEEIEGAGSAGEANAKALELFGARAGPDMAAAIREGRFEIDGLLSSVASSKDTIGSAAKETDGWSETFSRLKNRITIGVEPLATKLVAGLDSAAVKAEPLIAAIGERLPDAFATVQRHVASLQPVLTGVAAVVAAVATFLSTKVAPQVAAFASYLAGQFSNLAGWVRTHWSQIQEAIGHVLVVVQTAIAAFVAVALAAWRLWGDDLLKVAQAVWGQIQRVVKTAVDLVRGVIELGLALINGDWSRAWDSVKGIVSTVWSAIAGTVKFAIDVVTGILGAGMDAAAQLVRSGLDQLVGFFAGLPSRITSATVGLLDGLKDTFLAALNAIIRAWNRLDLSISVEVPSWVPGLGGKGFHVDDIFPDAPEIRDRGGSTFPGRGYLVGPGLVEYFSPGRGHVMPQEQLVAALTSAGGRGAGTTIERLEVATAVDATADEVVDAINAKLGWKLTTRRDR